MKKTTLPRIVSLALVAAIPAALANTPLVETAFEADEGISTGPLPDSGPGWNTNGDYPFEISIDENDPDRGQIAVSTTETHGKGSRLWINRLDSANRTIVEIDLKANRSGHSGYQANLHLGRFAGEPTTAPRISRPGNFATANGIASASRRIPKPRLLPLGWMTNRSRRIFPSTIPRSMRSGHSESPTIPAKRFPEPVPWPSTI